MTVVFPKHKGDQEGEHCLPKHVYANPKSPEICPILAFAVYTWSIGFRREGAKRLVFVKASHLQQPGLDLRHSTQVERQSARRMPYK